MANVTMNVSFNHTEATEEIASRLLEVIPKGTEGEVNTEFTVRSMGSALGMPEEDESGMTMLVVGNATGKYGAIALFDKGIRQTVADLLKGDYIILPSSVHEVICVPEGSLEAEEANQMVRAVNAQELMPEEVLAEHAFLYKAREDEIVDL